MKKVLLASILGCIMSSCSGPSECDHSEKEDRLQIELCLDKTWKTDHSGFNDNYTIKTKELSVEIFGHAITPEEASMNESAQITWNKWFALTGCSPHKQDGLKIDATEAWMGSGFFINNKTNTEVCQTMAYVQKNNREYFIQCRCDKNKEKESWDLVKKVSTAIRFLK